MSQPRGSDDTAATPGERLNQQNQSTRETPIDCKLPPVSPTALLAIIIILFAQ